MRPPVDRRHPVVTSFLAMQFQIARAKLHDREAYAGRCRRTASVAAASRCRANARAATARSIAVTALSRTSFCDAISQRRSSEEPAGSTVPILLLRSVPRYGHRPTSGRRRNLHAGRGKQHPHHHGHDGGPQEPEQPGPSWSKSYAHFTPKHPPEERSDRYRSRLPKRSQSARRRPSVRCVGHWSRA